MLPMYGPDECNKITITIKITTAYEKSGYKKIQLYVFSNRKVLTNFNRMSKIKINSFITKSSKNVIK
jgi:hypothetical protein